MNGIGWYWSRLRCMSAREVGFRIGRSAHMQLERTGLLRNRMPPQTDSRIKNIGVINPPADLNTSRYVAAAEAILAGRVDFLGSATLDVGFPPDWNRNAKSGQQAPLRFGKTLNYRDHKLGGDIKYLWVPNRHLQLVRLAQAFALTGDDRYSQPIRLLLSSWMDACPHPNGPNWTSSLEVSLRLINWSLTWQLVGGAESKLFDGEAGARLRNRWLDSVYLHLSFIRGHLSRYSSANNHLIGELAGLVVGTATWPCWPDAETWLVWARQGLEDEALLQNHPDGVNREQSTFYQHFVLDFLLLAGLHARAAGTDMSKRYWQRCERMLEYLASIMDAAGHVPQIGDADDGYVVRLSTETEFCPYRSLLATGAVLFDRKDLKARAGRLDEKTQWLLSESSQESFAALGEPEHCDPIRRSFPDGGYYLLGCDFNSLREVRMLIDAGPLGYPSIAAHGHADALSICLSMGGQEILVDPGTYAYQSADKWRRYFRGTSAHNTVAIDGLDQSVMGGKFMWLKSAQAGCEEFTAAGTPQVFQGWQNGYERLADPVRHDRRVEFDPQRREFTIIDSLRCNAAHQVERFWHFAEHCEIQLVGGEVRVKASGVTLVLSPGGSSTLVHTYRGSERPCYGWRSPTFMAKNPAWTVVFEDQVSTSQGLSSVLRYQFA